ncbi:MAG TPA: serine/threonine-protein kinase [Kofleriaceae bacterium]|nr:serine/threonine-protein kinase [Kofleriaceae bacterium]
MRDDPTQREKPAGRSGGGREQAPPPGLDDTIQSEPAGAPTQRPRSGGFLSRGAPVDRYVVIDILGQGGMGVVYAAYDPDLDRKVALKLLRAEGGGDDDTDGRARLLREAQALARLSHPNVVSVYDVGDTGDGVWIAMEYVDGPSLKRWLADDKRSWREIVGLFRKAGRGLAVAHERGVVHRDVKPDNIFLWRDGRVCIGDFGLASVRGGTIENATTIPDDDLARMKPLTLTGMVMGTPPYMPPEQLHGRPADARSDQFSFCVALFEALYGERPFEGENLLALRKAAEAGQVREPPAGARVPAWVRRVVVRGLAADPERRYPSVAALLDDLGRDPKRTRRRALMAGGGALFAAALVTGVALATGPSAGALCQGGDDEMAAVWNPARSEAIHAAFRKTGAADADDAWKRVSAALDDYRDGWVAMHRDACEATHVRGEQSARLLDLRMACLDRRRIEVDEMVSMFSHADGAMVRHAVEATSSISGLDGCADIDALTSDEPERASAAQRTAIAGLEDELAKANAHHHAGQIPEALARAETIAKAAKEVGYDPFTAKAGELFGWMQRLSGDYDDATETLFDAAVLGEASGAVRPTAHAWLDLALLVGQELAHPDQGLRYARLAEAAITRAGKPRQLTSRLHNVRGALLDTQGKFSASEAEYKRAFAIDDQILEPQDPDRANDLTNLGNAAYRLGHYEDARKDYELALDIRQRALGPNHPSVAVSRLDLGIVLEAQGDLDGALASYQQGLAINRHVFGEGSIRVADSLASMGGAYHALGRFEDALEVNRRALEIRLKVLGDHHPDVAQNYNNIAIAEKNLGRFDEARVAYGEAIHIYEAGGDDTRFPLGVALNNLGEAARAEGHVSEAIAAYQRSLAILSGMLEDDNPILAHPLTGLGIAYVDAGRASRGKPLLERALKLRQAQKINPVDLAETEFGLARALWGSSKDRKRARDLAGAARDAFAAAGTGRAKDRDAVVRWLAGH